jgi:y4mF family transcriptional regulator
MTVNLTDIGKIIQRHRKAAGLSQKELADLAGIGKATVFDIEKGKETVRMVNVFKALSVLNISLELVGPLTGKEDDR